MIDNLTIRNCVYDHLMTINPKMVMTKFAGYFGGASIRLVDKNTHSYRLIIEFGPASATISNLFDAVVDDITIYYYDPDFMTKLVHEINKIY